ncbi:hypothetical protein MTO96_006455 [Rhipicephalus appendiculatus]
MTPLQSVWLKIGASLVNIIQRGPWAAHEYSTMHWSVNVNFPDGCMMSMEGLKGEDNRLLCYSRVGKIRAEATRPSLRIPLGLRCIEKGQIYEIIQSDEIVALGTFKEPSKQPAAEVQLVNPSGKSPRSPRSL